MAGRKLQSLQASGSSQNNAKVNLKASYKTVYKQRRAPKRTTVNKQRTAPERRIVYKQRTAPKRRTVYKQRTAPKRRLRRGRTSAVVKHRVTRRRFWRRNTSKVMMRTAAKRRTVYKKRTAPKRRLWRRRTSAVVKHRVTRRRFWRRNTSKATKRRVSRRRFWRVHSSKATKRREIRTSVWKRHPSKATERSEIRQVLREIGSTAIKRHHVQKSFTSNKSVESPSYLSFEDHHFSAPATTHNNESSWEVVKRELTVIDVSVESYSKALFQHLSMFFGKDRKMLEKCQKAF